MIIKELKITPEGYSITLLFTAQEVENYARINLGWYFGGLKNPAIDLLRGIIRKWEEENP